MISRDNEHEYEHQRLTIIEHEINGLMRYVKEYQGPAFRLTERERDMLDDIEARVDLIQQVLRTDNNIELVRRVNCVPERKHVGANFDFMVV